MLNNAQFLSISSPTTLVVAVLALSMYSALRRVIRKDPFRNIPGPKAESWTMGNLKQLFNSKGLPFHEHLTNEFGGMAKDEQLYISDPHAIQAILGRQQDCFEETAVFLETNKLIFGPGLVATKGDLHKRQRKLASPMFSTAQLAKVTPTFYEIAEKLVSVLSNEITVSESAGQMGKGNGNRGGVLDMSEWLSRVSLEMVGRAVLGYSFDPLDSKVNNPYTSAIKELIPTLFSFALVRQFTPFLVKLGPASFRRKIVERIPSRRVQKVKEISDVMHQYAGRILKERREQQKEIGLSSEGSSESERGKDIISMLLKANEKAREEERMGDDELTGQMTVLIFGAQDTTSSALSRIIYLLSTHSEVQKAVRAELREAHQRRRAQNAEGEEEERETGRLDQETIMSLPYLDAVVKETLRMYPPVPFVRRSCVKDTVLPYTPHSEDWTHEQTTSVRVPKGTTIFIGIQGMNRLETVWGDDAKEWKPQRWMNGSKGDAAGDKPGSGPYKSTVKIPAAFSGMLSFLGGDGNARAGAIQNFALVGFPPFALPTSLARRPDDTTMPRKRRDPSPSSSASDDDDAPETVTLTQSKQHVQQRESNLRQAQLNAKEKQKEKNRELDKKLKERAEVNRNAKEKGKGKGKEKGKRTEGKAGKEKKVAVEEVEDFLDEGFGEDVGSGSEDGDLGDIDPELEARMLKAMRDAEGEEGLDGSGSDDSDDDDDEGGEDGEELDSEDGDDDDVVFGEDDGEEDSDEDDDDDDDEKEPPKSTHLPDELFKTAFQQSQPPVPPKSKSKSTAVQPSRKRRRTKEQKEFSVGSKKIRLLPDPILHPAPNPPSAVPSKKINKFLDRTLALKGRAAKAKLGWERRPAHIGLLRSINGPAAHFVRNGG
ncbi:hypothetical protein MD484_g6313, partial [Candolleomyces efflorescens]